MRLLNEIMELLLGMKYYAVVLHRRNTEIYDLCSYIFPCTDEGMVELQSYVDSLRDNKSFEYVDIVSFRSRKMLPCEIVKRYRH